MDKNNDKVYVVEVLMNGENCVEMSFKQLENALSAAKIIDTYATNRKKVTLHFPM